MKKSVTLLEREGRSAALEFTSSLICGKRSNGAFALWLIETSGLGELRHIVAREIRTPSEFVDAVLSLNQWTDLHLNCRMIRDEICVPLARLDRDFATVVEHVAHSRIALTDPQAA